MDEICLKRLDELHIKINQHEEMISQLMKVIATMNNELTKLASEKNDSTSMYKYHPNTVSS